MRDRQAAAYLRTRTGFSRGMISSDKPFQCVSLSEVLESEVLTKYFLSPKACLGILRRAEKRGKELPKSLYAALQQVAMAGESEQMDQLEPLTEPEVMP